MGNEVWDDEYVRISHGVEKKRNVCFVTLNHPNGIV